MRTWGRENVERKVRRIIVACRGDGAATGGGRSGGALVGHSWQTLVRQESIDAAAAATSSVFEVKLSTHAFLAHVLMHEDAAARRAAMYKRRRRLETLGTAAICVAEFMQRSRASTSSREQDSTAGVHLRLYRGLGEQLAALTQRPLPVCMAVLEAKNWKLERAADAMLGVEFAVTTADFRQRMEAYERVLARAGGGGGSGGAGGGGAGGGLGGSSPIAIPEPAEVRAARSALRTRAPEDAAGTRPGVVKGVLSLVEEAGRPAIASAPAMAGSDLHPGQGATSIAWLPPRVQGGTLVTFSAADAQKREKDKNALFYALTLQGDADVYVAMHLKAAAAGPKWLVDYYSEVEDTIVLGAERGVPSLALTYVLFRRSFRVSSPDEYTELYLGPNASGFRSGEAVPPAVRMYFVIVVKPSPSSSSSAAISSAVPSFATLGAIVPPPTSSSGSSGSSYLGRASSIRFVVE